MDEENIDIEDVRALLGDESDTVWTEYEEDDELILDKDGVLWKV